MIDKQFADLPLEVKKELPFTKEVYEAVPTADCITGIQGRAAVFEVLAMDKDIEQVVLKGATEADIQKLARAKGMITMKEDAILKAMNREIPFEEVNAL